MIIDPLARIKTSAGALPAPTFGRFYLLRTGETTIPRWREDIGAFCYQRMSDRGATDFRLVPYLNYTSSTETIIDGATIPFDVPDGVESAQSQAFALYALVYNVSSDYGYQPGNTLVPSDGVTLQPTDVSVLAHISSEGIHVPRLDRAHNLGRCDPAKWRLLLVGHYNVDRV